MWGPGARLRTPVGSRGNALAGVQGTEPPEAPGFSGFLRPKNASPRTVFLSFFKTSFAVKSVDIVAYSRPLRYKMI